jgi:chromatin assembly factor 1 subunit B
MKVETPQLRWHQIVNPQCQKDAGANGPILSCTLHTAASDGVVVAGVLATAGNAEVNLWRVRFTHDDARLCRLPEATTGGPRSSSSRILVQPQTKSAASVVVAAPDGSAAKSAALEGGGDDDDERTVIEHVVTLSRGTNERGINCVRFSPSGRYLVAACDGGTVVLYALPHNVGDNNANNDATTNVVVDPARWTSIERETDLSAKILFNQSDDVMDASWSADSRRFAVCSLDHTLAVWEHHGGNNNGDGGGGGGDNNWKAVHRSNKDHTHYIQGVSYDPKGVYLASMGSDRMVKVYARKEIREGAVSAELAKYDADATPPAKEEDGPPPPPPPPPPSSSSSMEEEEEEEEEEEDRLLRAEEERPPPRDSSSGESSRRAAILEDRVLPGLLTNTAFVLQNKIKTMKFLNANGKPARRSNSGESCGAGDDEDDTDNGKDALPPSSSLSSSPPPGKGTDDNNNPSPPPSSSAKRHHMFADELTLGSFFRRLSFTADGAFLVVPAALWHGRRNNDDGGSDGGGGGGGGLSPGSPTSVLSGGVDRLADSSFATYLFARHHYDQPYKVLAGLEKVRACRAFHSIGEGK